MDKSFIGNQTEEQLMLLRDLTRRFSILHEAQVLQLKYWPLCLFQTAKDVESPVDLEKREITFILKMKGNGPKDLKERCETLNGWVKWLLGNDWVVRIRIREKQVFRGGPVLIQENEDADRSDNPKRDF